MPRVKFRKGLQSKILADTINLTGLNWSEMAKILNISQRTLLEWRKERYLLSLDALEKLSKVSGKKLMRHGTYKILPDYWNIKNAAKKGGLALAKKYGGPGNAEGRRKGGIISQKKRKLFPELYKNCNLSKEIIVPGKSVKLAEFIGIVLGDGGISNPSQITISLSRENDKLYAKYVISMIKELFGIAPKVYKLTTVRSRNVIRITVTASKLVSFLEKQGIKIGSKVKHQVGVPNWIIRNKAFSLSCLRGLIDTDGGIYYHRHKTNGCNCFNLGLVFSNHSVPLIEFVEKTLVKFGFNPKRNSDGTDVLLYRLPEILKYSQEIGFSNSHHRERVEVFIKEKK